MFRRFQDLLAPRQRFRPAISQLGQAAAASLGIPVRFIGDLSGGSGVSLPLAKQLVPGVNKARYTA
jgi:hypothetical protein